MRGMVGMKIACSLCSSDDDDDGGGGGGGEEAVAVVVAVSARTGGSTRMPRSARPSMVSAAAAPGLLGS